MEHLDREAAIDRLYAAPLEAFVLERTRLCRELRSAGDRPAAAEIAKLSKPSAATWALNHVAREKPVAVAEWIEAFEALRNASARADEGGDALRLAMGAHRAASSRLIAEVREGVQPSGRPLSESMLDRVRALLQAATTEAGLAEKLQAGRISEERRPTRAEPESEPRKDPGMVERPPRAPRRQRNARTARSPNRDREAEARVELERRVGATMEELERLREQAVLRAAAADSANQRLDEARRALHRVESEAAAAGEAAKDAGESVAALQQKLQQLRALR